MAFDPAEHQVLAAHETGDADRLRFPGLAAQEVQRFAQRRIRQGDQVLLHAQGGIDGPSGFVFVDPLLGLLLGPAVRVLFRLANEPVCLQHHGARIAAFGHELLLQASDDDRHAVDALQGLAAETVGFELVRVPDAEANLVLGFLPDGFCP